MCSSGAARSVCGVRYHSVLLSRLQTRQGITGAALSWFRSYLTNRKQSVVIQWTSGLRALCWGLCLFVSTSNRWWISCDVTTLSFTCMQMTANCCSPLTLDHTSQRLTLWRCVLLTSASGCGCGWCQRTDHHSSRNRHLHWGERHPSNVESQEYWSSDRLKLWTAATCKHGVSFNLLPSAEYWKDREIFGRDYSPDSYPCARHLKAGLSKWTTAWAFPHARWPGYNMCRTMSPALCHVSPGGIISPPCVSTGL